MTTTRADLPPAGPRVRDLVGGSGAIAVAIVVMNVSTYGFQMVAARLLGPEQYGGVAGIMNLLLIVGVLQLSLQATGARRVAAAPGEVEHIERVVLGLTYRAALALGLLMLALAPVVWRVLRLDTITPALLMAAAAVPLTVMGGQAGILQGERRWHALGLMYLGMGLPRLLVGAAAIAVRPTEAAAMLGVAIALCIPVAIGAVALRRPHDRPHDRPDDRPPDRQQRRRSSANGLRATGREALHSSSTLLAFFVLSNIDIVLARNVLPTVDAGWYAGGLILTKAVLFLPQAVVVVSFPALSTPAERRRALLRSLEAVTALGAACIAGAALLPGLAMFFVGGDDYAGVRSRLWVFAVLGMVLAVLQLLVYSVLARQSRRSAYLVWAGVAAVLLAGRSADSLADLVLTVTTVDAALLLVLTGLSLWRLRSPDPPSAPDRRRSPAALAGGELKSPAAQGRRRSSLRRSR